MANPNRRKKPHLQRSEIAKYFNVEDEIFATKQRPTYDGLKVHETAEGYALAWRERGVETVEATFKTAADVQQHVEKKYGFNRGGP